MMAFSRRKLRKLVSRPHVFVRDYLLNRAEKRVPLADLRASKNPVVDFAQLLHGLDLGITAAATGRTDTIDVSLTDLPRLAWLMRSYAAQLPDRVYLFARGYAPVDFSGHYSRQILSFLTRTSPVELLLTTEHGAPLLRRRIIRWTPQGEFLEAGGQHVPLKRVRCDDGAVVTPARKVSDLSELRPIDAVYTWVNAADPDWQAMLSGFRDVSELDPDRFHQSDELRYSLRSLAMFAPWIRNVYVLSNCSPPSWFKGNDRYRWVRHEEVASGEFLPTFNSHSIETMLHNVPGLSEKFLYFNDDFFLADVVEPGDFFTYTGRSCCRFEPYGTVPYLEQLVKARLAEEWQSAAVNSARILQKDFGVFPTRMHQHVPYAIDRNVYAEIERRYPEDVIRVRGSRFRRHDDVSFTSFFYHHFAIATGAAEEREEGSFIVRPTNMRRFERVNSHRPAYRFFCVNDGGGSAVDEEYGAFKEAFLTKLYPIPSPAETRAPE